MQPFRKPLLQETSKKKFLAERQHPQRAEESRHDDQGRGDVGGGGGIEDLGVGGVGDAEGYVLADGVGEEEGLLGDEADVARRSWRV